MPKKKRKAGGAATYRETLLQRQRTLLAQQDDNGVSPDTASSSFDEGPEIRKLTNAELVQLQVRVIALENVVIALLSSASSQGRDLARYMASYILPRPGFTQHPLTIHAAHQMRHLVERANIFRDKEPLESIHADKTAE